MSRSQPLHALNLLRLAESAPGKWTRLPGADLAVTQVRRRVDGPGAGYLVCVSGEVVVDFPQGSFVALRQGETFLTPPHWTALALTSQATLLYSPISSERV